MKVGAWPPRPDCGARGRWRGLVAAPEGPRSHRRRIPMFVTYPDACWCQLISPSITGLRHYRSGCALLPGARSAHERRDEAHDPRQSRSDTSPPISQAVPGLQSGSDETHFVPPSSRETKPGTKRSLHGQNSPNSTLLGEQGEFCHGHAPKFLDRARSVRPQAVRSHVNPLARTSTGYSIDGQAPHTGPAGPGCGTRGRWRGLAGLRDRSLRAESSRVAISRAGRRPRAHKAARPGPRLTLQP